MKKIAKIKGMNDFEGELSLKLSNFIETVSQIVQKYGYTYIKTPHVEETALYKRSVGDSSDVVNKEMYNFIDKGENDICLRPEGTAGVVRSYIESGYDKQNNKKRYYYYGEMYRYERPQKGRYREFLQFGCESFGSGSSYEDTTMLVMVCEILDSLGISYTLELNSIGDSAFRTNYINDILKPFLVENIDHICSDCKTRKDTNPIRVFDCKNSSCQEVYKKVTKLTDALDSSSKLEFETILKRLDRLNIRYIINKNLVRGLDYYNSLVFEFTTDELGAQGTLVGGGRYDSLVSTLGGNSTQAVGFAMGIDRLLQLMEDGCNARDGIYFGCLDSDALEPIYDTIYSNKQEIKTYLEYKPKSHTKHISTADKLNFKYCCIVSSDDITASNIRVKNLLTKDEQTYSSISEIRYD